MNPLRGTAPLNSSVEVSAGTDVLPSKESPTTGGAVGSTRLLLHDHITDIAPFISAYLVHQSRVPTVMQQKRGSSLDASAPRLLARQYALPGRL
jgi:hypothetical protein